MIPVHRVLPQVLSNILRNAPQTPEKVVFVWQQAVGPALDRATTVELKGNVLHVTAKDATWRREVQRSAALIRSRLDGLLGDGVVQRIEIRDAPRGRRKSTP